MEEHGSDSHADVRTHVELKGGEAHQVVDVDDDYTENLVEDGSAEKAVFLDAIGSDSKEPNQLNIDAKKQNRLSEYSVGYFFGG